MTLRALVLPEAVECEFDLDVDVPAGPVYALPGLVDAHCHISLEDLGAGTFADAIRHAIQDRDAGTLLIREAGAPDDTHWSDAHPELPKIIRAGRWIARPKRYLRYYAVEIEPDELVAEVERQAANGDGWVKIVGDWIDREVGDLTPLWPDDVAAAAITAAHRLGVRMTAHCFGYESARQLVDAGIDCIEHGTGADADLLREMAERQIPIVPTLTNIENFPMYARQGAARFPRYAAHMWELYQRRFATFRMAYELGVPLFAGTDAGGVVSHGLIAGEIRLLAQISNPEYALGAASWRARAWLGAPASLLADEAADFVAYGADPRQDLSVLDTPLFTVLDGVVYPHA
ncbi:MAG: amidohydrolase [Propionibacteriaceae bacterium]|nr:amidohydrolase [Propionibacteriaceae bacterium]